MMPFEVQRITNEVRQRPRQNSGLEEEYQNQFPERPEFQRYIGQAMF